MIDCRCCKSRYWTRSNFKSSCKKDKYGPDVKLRTMQEVHLVFCADLANLINESALLAARKNKRVVTMSDIEEAKDVMMGAERRSMVMSEDEKINCLQVTCYCSVK